MYRLNEKTNNLAALIRQYTPVRELYNEKRDIQVEADNAWGICAFLHRLMQMAKPADNYHFGRKEVETLARQF